MPRSFALVFGLASILPAQGLVLPTGHEKTTTDPGISLTPSPTTHMQYCYGSLQGSSKLAVVKRLSFRREATLVMGNQARTWSNVALRVSDCDFAAMSDIYADNLISPTLVFSASVAWPATVGKPSSNPPPWGMFASTTGFDVSFPFASTFVHVGKYGFAADFQFSGGTMANGGSWQTYTVAGVTDTNSAIVHDYANYGSSTCRATGRSAPSFLTAWMFSYNVPGPSRQFRYSFWGEGYPNNTAFVGALGLAGSTTGIPFLTSCQKLHLNLAQPVQLLPGKSDSVGFYWTKYATAPYVPSLVGTKVWTQAAFDDQSVLQLTQGGTTTIDPAPGGTPEYGCRIYSTQIGGYTPGGWGDLSDNLVPLIYLHQ